MPTMVPKRKKKPGALGATTNGSGGNFTDSAMDEFLAKRSLYRKPIAKDGSCLFRAVAEQVHNCQAKHLDVRKQCIEFMRQNREMFEEFVEGPFDHHLFKLTNPKEWAGQVEITALSQMYRKDFVVYQDINSSPTKVTDHGYKDKILLCYSNGNHYDIIYPGKFHEHAAMCQSILFEMLYNKVFIELDKKENSNKGKPKGTNHVDNSRNNQKCIQEWVNGCISEEAETVENSGDDDGWTEVKSKARAKHERQAKPVEVEENKESEEIKGKVNNDQKYLWELRRSADPHLYRNISLEVWEEEKHILQQQDLAVAVSLQYRNNDRCLVKLAPPNAPNDKYYNAIIKEDYCGSGSVLVYIPELKEKQAVPVHLIKPSEHQQGHNYKDLSGYYKKEDAANGPISEEGSKDDNKSKKKRQPRIRRGPGKGGDDSGNVSEDAPRGRGRQRDRHSRRRLPGSKDERSNREDEEAKFMAKQIVLVELQEKDPKAFPALPVRGNPQVSPTAPAINPPPPPPPAEEEEKIKVPHPTQQVEEKAQDKDKDSVANESTPAEFWSRLKAPKAKITNETANQSSSLITSPTTKQQENQSQQNFEETANEVMPNNEERFDKKEQQEPTLSEDVLDEPIPEKEAFIDNVGPNCNVEQITAQEKESKHYQAAIEIKPLMSDVKHTKTTGQVYEVKISQPAKLMQQAKISPPSKPTQQPRKQTHTQPSDTRETDKILPVSLVESHNQIVDQDLPKSEKLIENEEEINALHNKESQDLQFTMESSPDKPLNAEELYFQPEQNCAKEEESIKINETKVIDAVSSTTTPERKTVTFAESHKEIPVGSYSQSQKGILIVNGTNRSNQSGDQGYKSPNPEDFTPVSKDPKQDFVSPPHAEKDHQSFPAAIANESLQSSSPTAQQQAAMQYMVPILPHGVQLPTGMSTDPNGSDLPQDPQTLRFFFNLGYQYLLMASQMQGNPLPLVYMYPGTMQDPMMQQPAQPVVSLSQPQIYGNMQHQQISYPHSGIQNYQPPFHVPQTSQDTTSQHDRTSERTNPPPHHQQQIQPQQQIPLAHQQQSGHFQQPTQFSQQWRTGRGHYNNTNKPHVSHHGSVSQSRTTYHQSSAGTPRPHHYRENNKQNRKPQVIKSRNNDSYSPHYGSSSHPHGQNMAHNPTTPTQAAYYPIPEQNKGPGHDYYQNSPVVFNYHHPMQSGMPNLPHSAGNSRAMYN